MSSNIQLFFLNPEVLSPKPRALLRGMLTRHQNYAVYPAQSYAQKALEPAKIRSAMRAQGHRQSTTGLNMWITYSNTIMFLYIIWIQLSWPRSRTLLLRVRLKTRRHMRLTLDVNETFYKHVNGSIRNLEQKEKCTNRIPRNLSYAYLTATSALPEVQF